MEEEKTRFKNPVIQLEGERGVFQFNDYIPTYDDVMQVAKMLGTISKFKVDGSSGTWYRIYEIQNPEKHLEEVHEIAKAFCPKNKSDNKMNADRWQIMWYTIHNN